MPALHGTLFVEGPTQTFEGDLNELNAYRPALHALNPNLASHFDNTVLELQASMSQQEELYPVVSHGALRTDQFLIDGEQLVMIDLDGVCWSNPARDLGNFLAYLTWKALRQPHKAAFIAQAKEAFLHGYASARTLPSTQWLHAYEAASMLKIVGRRYTGLTRKEWHLTEELLSMAA